MPKKTKKGKERLDKFYSLAKDQGYRARSAFKLIQLAKKFNFLSKSKVCLDLCAAPGGWSQVAQRNMPVGSKIIAIDLAPIKPLPGVTCIQSDITTEKCRSEKKLQGSMADVVLHDGAPNVGTAWAKDAYDQAELTLHSLRLACDFLRVGGVFVTKVFRSKDYNSLLWVFNQLFNKVDATKPTASRNVSAEIFVMCIGLKQSRSKIDSKFFDPKWVFMETVEEPQDEGKKPGASLTEYFKKMKKKHRDGYEEGDDMRIIPAQDFIASDKPAEILIKAHKLNLEAPGCEPLARNPLTRDVVDLCQDLKVLGKADLSQLLKWRMKILREQQKNQREAEKKAKEDPTTLAVRAKAKLQAAKAAAKKAVDRGLAPDLDSAIAQFLDGAELTEGPEGAASASEDEAADDRLEQDLKQQIDKRRKEDRKEAKRMMDRQRKQEWRKKMSLVTGRGGATGEQPELFRVTDKSVKALEDDSAIPNECLSEEEPDTEAEKEMERARFEASDSDDDQMDRLARMEVDLALDYEMRKAHLLHKKRNVVQRTEKAKKETRRQRVVQSWAAELTDFSERQQSEAKALQDLGEDALEDEEDDSDDDLKALRKFQDMMQEAEDAEDGEGGDRIDGAALEALADGPEEEGEDEDGGCLAKAREGKGKAIADAEAENEEEAETPKLQLADRSETALVPHTEEELRGEQRASRWFSQGIFAGLKGKRSLEDSDSDQEGEMHELTDAQLPKLPLTDKAKRKIERRKNTERLEKLGIKPKKKEEEEEKGGLEVAPLEPPKPLVPSQPSDPRELAETLAIGSLLVESKKSRMDLLDAGYNRYTFDPNPALPVWFLDDEDKYNKPEIPISKEQFNQFRQRLAEINRRPIRKVAEARARKKKRMAKKLEKLRSTAMALAETSDMSEHAKARQMRKAVNKLAKQDQRPVTSVAIKKGGGGHKLDKKKVPKGAKVKTVDRRMKADLRGEKKARKRNPGRFKVQQRKVQQKINKGKRRGMGDKGTKTGGKKRKAPA
eukprot:CAMPEP_0181534826 /NCGR_PEP_ID=MMETSP1110-20121109/73942_1 /TAXON_ID=174948 /ORGANISM="Symbiodinium sp., Strain CCMP421" /LENGTH=1008 /DNA_ID=CAMNT_0023666191 /DNA_START=94 /DNA_END=3121 /DNA_ORIENTATION=+